MPGFPTYRKFSGKTFYKQGFIYKTFENKPRGPTKTRLAFSKLEKIFYNLFFLNANLIFKYIKYQNIVFDLLK